MYWEAGVQRLKQVIAANALEDLRALAEATRAQAQWPVLGDGDFACLGGFCEALLARLAAHSRFASDLDVFYYKELRKALQKVVDARLMHLAWYKDVSWLQRVAYTNMDLAVFNGPPGLDLRGQTQAARNADSARRTATADATVRSSTFRAKNTANLKASSKLVSSSHVGLNPEMTLETDCARMPSATGSPPVKSLKPLSAASIPWIRSRSTFSMRGRVYHDP